MVLRHRGQSQSCKALHELEQLYSCWTKSALGVGTWFSLPGLVWFPVCEPWQDRMPSLGGPCSQPRTTSPAGIGELKPYRLKPGYSCWHFPLYVFWQIIVMPAQTVKGSHWWFLVARANPQQQQYRRLLMQPLATMEPAAKLGRGAAPLAALLSASQGSMDM